MPLPLLLVPVGVAVVAVIGGGIALVLSRIAKKLENRRVAILGGAKVGKTTLLRTLRDATVPDRALTMLDHSWAGRFEMDVRGRSVEFDVPRDIAANDLDLSYKSWKDAFTEAHYVWYLFRADLVAAGDPDTLDRVKGHLARFKGWMDADKSLRPRIILIGTHADVSPQFEADSGKLIDAVRSASPIKLGMVKLNHADLVVGSLLTDKDAKRLIRRLGSHL
ncbi:MULTISPECIES: GTPase domain-containing protein [unclassified Microbacterium]|uniref:GTPase domain-containing protein n=2 Tax=Actinomycetes TaxID=1760 RepID=UPI003C2ED9A7